MKDLPAALVRFSDDEKFSMANAKPCVAGCLPDVEVKWPANVVRRKLDVNFYLACEHMVRNNVELPDDGRQLLARSKDLFRPRFLDLSTQQREEVVKLYTEYGGEQPELITEQLLPASPPHQKLVPS